MCLLIMQDAKLTGTDTVFTMKGKCLKPKASSTQKFISCSLCELLNITTKKKSVDISTGLCSVWEIIAYTHEIFFAQNLPGQMVFSVRE